MDVYHIQPKKMLLKAYVLSSPLNKRKKKKRKEAKEKKKKEN